MLKVRDGDVTAASPSGYNDRIFRLEGSTSTPSSGNVWRLNLREVQPSLAATETVQVSIRVPEEVTCIIVFWGGPALPPGYGTPMIRELGSTGEGGISHAGQPVTGTWQGPGYKPRDPAMHPRIKNEADSSQESNCRAARTEIHIGEIYMHTI